VPLFETGLEKVAAGIINLDELLQETSNIEDYDCRSAFLTPGNVNANPV